MQNMLSPRSNYITLLQSKKTGSMDKTRNIYLASNNSKKLNLQSLGKSKFSKLDTTTREKNRSEAKRSYKKLNSTTRQSTTKLETINKRPLSKKKEKSSTTTAGSFISQDYHEEQCKKYMKGQNCRIVVKINGKQHEHFLQVRHMSEVRKLLFQSYPRAKNFVTIPRQYSLEFLMTQEHVAGEFLNGQSLYFKPEFEQMKQKTSQHQKVGLKDFEFIKQLGSGGFSKVFLCRSKIDNNFYAIKMIDKEMVTKYHKKGIIMNQRNIMVKSKHAMVIQLKYAFEAEKYIVFVLEYCPGGELFGVLKKYGRMTEEQARFYIIEVLLGLSYLHSEKVVYRDIKPENILLGLDGHVKIADLGLAKPDMHTGTLAHSFCGSPQYMAPQMIMQVGHTFPVDFYCVGALLYELLTGLPPYYSQDANQIYEAVLNEQLTFPEDLPLSSECKSLLRGLLTKDPKHRLGSLYGSKQVLIHPWFGKQNYKAYIEKQICPPIKFDNLQAINLDSQEDGDKAENLQKLLKDQKYESRHWKTLMKNFDYDFMQLVLKKKAEETKREPSADRQQIRKDSKSSRKSLEKQNNSYSSSLANLKGYKRPTAMLPLQNSLKNFFKK